MEYSPPIACIGPISGRPPTTTVLTPACVFICSTKSAQPEEQNPSVSYLSVISTRSLLNECSWLTSTMFSAPKYCGGILELSA